MLFESGREVKWLSCGQRTKPPICDVKGCQVWNIWRWKPVPFGHDSDLSFIWTECSLCSESDTSQSANQAKSSVVSVLFLLQNLNFSKLNVILQQVKNLQVSLLAEDTNFRFERHQGHNHPNQNTFDLATFEGGSISKNPKNRFSPSSWHLQKNVLRIQRRLTIGSERRNFQHQRWRTPGPLGIKKPFEMMIL